MRVVIGSARSDIETLETDASQQRERHDDDNGIPNSCAVLFFGIENLRTLVKDRENAHFIRDADHYSIVNFADSFGRNYISQEEAVGVRR